MEYFKINSKEIFPWIKDFTNPQKELRNMKVKDMDYGKWFWFHPTAFNMLYAAPSFFSTISFIIVAVLFLQKSFILTLIFGLFAVLTTIDTVQKIQKILLFKKGNFYDLFVRDW